MSKQCIIVTSSGLCTAVVDVDPLDTYTPPAGYSVAPDSTGEEGDTWTGSAWTAGSSPPALPPAGTSFVEGSSTKTSLKANSIDVGQLDGSGRLIMSSLVTNESIPVGIGLEAGLQVNQSGSQGAASIIRYSNDALGSYLLLGKGRAASPQASTGVVTALSSGDVLGQFVFFGSNGAGGVNNFVSESAKIVGVAAAAFTGTSTPGYLAFFTTPAGSLVPVENMRMTSAGQLVLGNPAATTANALWHVNNTTAGNSLLIEDSSSPDTTPFLIDAAGRMVTGHTAALSGIVSSVGLAGTPQGQTIGTSAGSMTDASFAFIASSAGTAYIGHKSRSATIGGHAVVNAGDVALALVGAVSDGVDFQRVGQMNFEADGASLVGSTAGRWRLLLTPSGSTTPVEAVRVDNLGNVSMGWDAANNVAPLYVGRQSNVSAVYTMLSLNYSVTGVAAAGIGVGMEYRTETGTGNGQVIARSSAVTTDVTAGSEDADYYIETIAAGTPTEVFRVKSTGQLAVTTGARVANGTVATAMSSVGPTGANTAIQGWLKISIGGTDRYVPYW